MCIYIYIHVYIYTLWMATSIMSAAKVTVAPATHDPAAAPAPILSGLQAALVGG